MEGGEVEAMPEVCRCRGGRHGNQCVVGRLRLERGCQLSVLYLYEKTRNSEYQDDAWNVIIFTVSGNENF